MIVKLRAAAGLILATLIMSAGIDYAKMAVAILREREPEPETEGDDQ